MKKYFFTLFCFGFILSGRLSAQEKQMLTQDVNVDDLGNVTDEFQEHFFEALKQRGIENYEKAIVALERCKGINPLPVIFYELGKNYKSLENYSSAIDNLKTANQLAPENKDIIAELYDAYFLIQDYDNSIATVKKLIVHDPDFSEDLANLYILTEQYEEALKVLDKLDAESGKSNYRDSLRRRIYASSNNRDSQISILKNRIENDPENEENYLNLIYVYSENGDVEAAFETARLLVLKNPNSDLAHLALYKFYLDSNNTSKAIKSMDIVLHSEIIDIESKYKLLNDFLLFVNQYPEYESKLEEIANLFADLNGNAEVYEKLGDYYIQKQNTEKALRFYILGLTNDSGNFNLLKQVILLNLDIGNSPEAKKYSETALEYYPSQPLFYLLHGVAENNLKNFKIAEESLLFGLDFIIDDKKMQVDFYKQLILAYKGLRNNEKAAAYEQQLLSLKDQE